HQRAVLPADADGTYAQTFHQLDQTLIHTAEHHLCHFHRIFVRHAQTVDKLRLHADFSDPLADLLAAAVDNNRLESDQLQEGHVLNHPLLQFLINHGASAVFHNDDLTVK